MSIEAIMKQATLELEKLLEEQVQRVKELEAELGHAHDVLVFAHHNSGVLQSMPCIGEAVEHGKAVIGKGKPGGDAPAVGYVSEDGLRDLMNREPAPRPILPTQTERHYVPLYAGIQVVKEV